MRIVPMQHTGSTPAAARIQSSRKPAHYAMRDELDPFVLTSPEDHQHRAVAAEASAAVALLMQRLAYLKSSIDQHITAMRKAASDALIAQSKYADAKQHMLDRLNDCLRTFDEHPSLRRSLRDALCEPLSKTAMQQTGITAAGSPQLFAAAPNIPSGHRSSPLPRSKEQSLQAADWRALFGPAGAAPLIRQAIERIERSPSIELLEPKLLHQLTGGAGRSYSPYIRSHSYSRHGLNLLLRLKG